MEMLDAEKVSWKKRQKSCRLGLRRRKKKYMPDMWQSGEQRMDCLAVCFHVPAVYETGQPGLVPDLPGCEGELFRGMAGGHAAG